MSEFFAILVVLGLVLAFVTVVGHGIWTLLAYLFKGASSADAAAKPVEGEACPRCLTAFRSGEATCAVCNWPQALPLGERRLSAVLAVRRQLYLYRQLGLVGEETFRRLADSLDAAATPVDAAMARAADDAAEAGLREALDAREREAAQLAEPTIVEAEVVEAEVVDAEPIDEKSAVSAGGSRIEDGGLRDSAQSPTGSDLHPPSSTLHPPKQPTPRPALGKLLSAFLEEKNIRWGELVGGMLIVCCSIALVISFWSEIAQRPLLKFCVFNGVSAAIFGAGLYTDRRWNLHTTSRGLLIVAILLVPLNFLAIAAFTAESPPTDLLSLAGEGVSIVLFAVLSLLAARVLVPDGPWLLAAGVMWPSVMQLLTRRYADADVSTAALYALAAGPLVSYVASIAVAIRGKLGGGSRIEDRGWRIEDGGLRKDAMPTSDNAGMEPDGANAVPPSSILHPPSSSFTAAAANRLFILLGIVTFATLLPLGLLLFKTEALLPTLERIAPLAAVVGLPSLALGMFFWRQVRSPELAREQTAGIAVGVLGAVVMLAAMPLAWPNPQTLLAASLIDAAALLLVAIWFAAPQTHVLVGASLITTTLVAYHVLAGNVAWDAGANARLTAAMLSAQSGNVLAPLVAAYLAVAYLWRRGRRYADALWWAIAAGVAAVASLVLLTVFGFARAGDPHDVTWAYLFFAAALSAASFWIGRRWIAWTASALALVAIVQGVVFRYADAWHIAAPWSAALLSHATLAVALYVLARRAETSSDRTDSRDDDAAEVAPQANCAAVWSMSGVATSIIAAVAMVVPLWNGDWLPLAGQLAWLSAVWLALAVVDVRALWFTAFQASLAAALFCGMTHELAARDWYRAATLPWLDPWFLQAQGVASAGYCIAWTALRIAVRRIGFAAANGDEARATASPWWLRCRTLLEPAWLPLDRLFEAGVVALVLALSTYAVAPLVAQELAPLDRPGLATRVAPSASEFAVSWMPLEHARGGGAWALVAVAIVLLVAGSWESRVRWRGIGLLLLGAAACALAATAWGDSVSAASALRWLVAGFVAVASAPLWMRATVVERLRRVGVDAWSGSWERMEGRGSRIEGELGHEASTTAPSILHPQSSILSGRFVPTARSAFALLVSLFVGVHLAMIAYVGVAVVAKSGVPAELLALLQAFAILAAVAVLLAVLVRLASGEEEGSRMEDGGSRASADRVTAAASSRDPRSSILNPRHLPTLALLLGIGPLFITYAFLVASALRQHPLCGPEPDAWFRTIGWSVSYGLPLAVFAATLVGHAIRERSSRIAFAAAILSNLIATVVYLLEIAKLGRPLDGRAWVEVAQVNAIVSAVAAIGWIAGLRWLRGRRDVEHGGSVTGNVVGCPRLLTTLVLLAAALWMLPMIPAVIGLAIEPRVWPWVAAAGGLIGWIAAMSVVAALGIWSAWALSPSERRSAAERAAGPFAAAVVAFVALAFAVFDHSGKWMGYHALMTGVVVASWLLPIVWRALTATSNRGNAADAVSAVAAAIAPSIGWSCLFGASAVALALRALDADPASPWWSLAALASTAALTIYLAWITARREFVWIAGVLTPLAASIWWREVNGRWFGETPWPEYAIHILYVNVIALAVVTLASLVIERQRVQRHRVHAAFPTRGFHRFASWLCIAIVCSAICFGISRDVDRSPLDTFAWLVASGLAAVTVAAVSCYWDAATRFMVARLWWVGLLLTLAVLDARDLSGLAFDVTLCASLAGYALLSSLVWNRRAALGTVAAAWGVPARATAGTTFENGGSRIDGTAAGVAVAASASLGHAWMIVANVSLAVVATALAFWIDTHVADGVRRAVAASGVLACALSLALLASGAPRAALQCAALAFGALFAMALGWAWLPLPIEAAALHRAVVAAVALAATIPLYGLVLARVTKEASGWPHAARRAVGAITVVASVVLLGVLAIEIDYFARIAEVPLRWPAVAAVLAALVMLSLASLSAAVLPGRDPLELGERGRMSYVYAAEVLLALAFLHVRLTMPWLFGGWFTRFWPLVVVAIAYLGVGFAELCRRRKLRVLSQPLENTGALLPLLPTFGFWMLSSQVNYSLLLLSVASLYSVLSLLRKSFWFGVLAAVAANGSLWYWLYATEGLAIYEHPQLWLIPPALCVLVAAYLNRQRLSDDQMTAIRYLSAVVVYASSTADVFLNGVGEAPWLPVALAGLSLLGIFAGILLRVRAFLYLGTTFLMVALFTVIWHAAVELDRTWIWWVTGIITGALIIALFGLFEKRRDDMLRLVERIKGWEA